MTNNQQNEKPKEDATRKKQNKNKYMAPVAVITLNWPMARLTTNPSSLSLSF
jgi:hypothetical protein